MLQVVIVCHMLRRSVVMCSADCVPAKPACLQVRLPRVWTGHHSPQMWMSCAQRCSAIAYPKSQMSPAATGRHHFPSPMSQMNTCDASVTESLRTPGKSSLESRTHRQARRIAWHRRKTMLEYAAVHFCMSMPAVVSVQATVHPADYFRHPDTLLVGPKALCKPIQTQKRMTRLAHRLARLRLQAMPPQHCALSATNL